MAKILETWEVLPHEPLVEIDEGLLSVAGDIPMPIGNFPRRMTVIRLSGQRTAIWSAIALDEPEMQRIEALGEPAFLIVPSDHHRMDAKIWKARYPRAKIVAPAGAVEAVEEVVPVDATDDILDDPDVHFLTVPGTARHEAALTVDRPSGLTLILNDVIGNVAHPHGIGANIMGRLFGFGVSEPQIPRPVKRMAIEDAPALARQFRAWAALPDLRRIIVSHGDVIEDDPGAVLEKLAAELG